MVLRLPDSWSNWNLEMLVFEEGENRSTRRKTSRSKGENQQQTQPTYGVVAGIWTQATLVGGECSHHCTTLAPVFSLYILFSQKRSCDNTPKNCFFQISSYSRAFVRIIYEKTKGQVPLEPLLGKQSMRVKQVYFVPPDINEKPTFSKLTLSWSGSS